MLADPTAAIPPAPAPALPDPVAQNERNEFLSMRVESRSRPPPVGESEDEDDEDDEEDESCLVRDVMVRQTLPNTVDLVSLLFLALPLPCDLDDGGGDTTDTDGTC